MGNHTTYSNAVRFNGANLRECDAGGAEDGKCQLKWDDHGDFIFDGSCLYT